jgi:hypothetical protein
MKTRTILMTLVATVCIVAALLIARRPAPAEPATRAANQPAPNPTPPVAQPPVPSTQPTPSQPPAGAAVASASPATPAEPKTAGKANRQAGPIAAQGAGTPDKPVTDPDARVALGWVGVDPEAEAYWEEAINDLSLPATERQDLIEDLNEDGLSDPKHPGPDDLPVILNRIQLIEQLAPYAADKVNDDAFAEAYKDLLNLAGLASGRGGEPVN